MQTKRTAFGGTKAITLPTRSIFFIAFTGLLLNVIFNQICKWRGLDYPFTSFLFYEHDRFGDFFRSIDYYNLTIRQGISSTYVTGISSRSLANEYHYFFAQLIHLTNSRMGVLLCYYALMLQALVVLALKKGNDLISILLMLISYPVLCALDRGNFALLIFLFILIALMSPRLWVSAPLIAISTGMRITPAIFIAPVVARCWPHIKSMAQVASLFVVTFLIFSDVADWHIRQIFVAAELKLPYTANELNSYWTYYVENFRGLAHNSSMFISLRFLMQKASLTEWFPYITPLSVMIGVFMVIGTILIIQGRLIATIRESFKEEKLIRMCCVCFVLFPPVTGDYYLLMLFIPLILYPHRRYTWGYCLIYGLVLAPKDYFFLDSLVNFQHVSWQVFANPILLLLILFAEFELGIRKTTENSNQLDLQKPAIIYQGN